MPDISPEQRAAWRAAAERCLAEPEDMPYDPRYVNEKLRHMLALLDALDAADTRIEELEAAIADALREVFRWADAHAAGVAHNEELGEEIERLRVALQECWMEYEELMPKGLYQLVKEALDIRIFTADLSGGSTNEGDEQ